MLSILSLDPDEEDQRELTRICAAVHKRDPLSALQRIKFIDRIYRRWLESEHQGKGGDIYDAVDSGISTEYNFKRFLGDFRVILQNEDVLIEDDDGGDTMECDGSSCHSMRRSLRDRSYRQSTTKPIDDVFFVDDDGTDSVDKLQSISAQEMMDTVHCHLVHSIRISPRDIEAAEKELRAKGGGADDDDGECHDYWTAAVCALMAERRKLPRFRDLNRFKSAFNKFVTVDVVDEKLAVDHNETKQSEHGDDELAMYQSAVYGNDALLKQHQKQHNMNLYQHIVSLNFWHSIHKTNSFLPLKKPFCFYVLLCFLMDQILILYPLVNNLSVNYLFLLGLPV